MNIIRNKKVAGVLAAFMLAVAALFVPVTPVNAADCEVTSGIAGGIDCANPGGDVPQTLFGAGSIFNTIINVLLFIIGAISVIMLIYGGIRYTTSGGASASVTAAKNTIMYAIIGLVVAFLAYAVVNWILVTLSPNA